VQDISKANSGGLSSFRRKQKVTEAFEITDVPSRCPVLLFELYQSKCPANRPDHAFYLRPLQHPTQKQWYSVAAVGVNTLSNTVSRLCKKAGFVGFFSNHSLRATAATRLFNANVEEQLVKLKTGHTSDAVQSYKRVSDVKLREMSDIVACKSGKLSTFGKNEAQESTATVADLSTVSTVSTTCPSTALSSAGLSHCTFSGNINIYLGER